MPKQRFTFILRVWLETDAGAKSAEPILRGSLQPINSPLISYFSSLQEISELVHKLGGWRAANRPPNESEPLQESQPLQQT